MSKDKVTLNPKDYPNEDDAEHLEDRGDNGLEEEEVEEQEEVDGEEGEPKPSKKPAKKSAKKADEEEDEDDEDDEDEDEDDDDEEADEKPKPGMVALHVLRKAQSKRREAEQRVRELEQRLQQQQESKSDRQKDQFEKMTARLEELYDQVEEARAEARTKDAAKLQRELDEIKGRMTNAQAAMLATKQALAAQANQAYNALVAELEVIDPRFDMEADEYDEDLVERVAELTEAYEAKNATAPDALRKALRMILGSDPFRDRRKLERAPEKKQPVVEKRKTDVKKNVETQKKTPKDGEDRSTEKPGKINVAALSEEDYDKLPESKKRELRGDFG